jgi:hypothetical protein
MTGPASTRLPDGLATEITRSLVSLWRRFGVTRASRLAER